ncbi:MAG TPA: hypothetical protein PLR20_14820 [Syntrophales bacterium]|jgi:hypothetical protein|nr:hypothetical protein [Syntrophales bacterium]
MKLRTKKEPVWITIKEGEGEAKVQVVPMSPKDAHEVLELAHEVEWDQGQRFKNVNLYRFKISKIKKCILDWKGIEDEDGKPILCTDENKEILYVCNPAFIDRILDEVDALSELEGKRLEDLIKNSKAGRTGTGRTRS